MKLFCAAAGLCVSILITGIQAKAQVPATRTDTADVVKITTKLVQMDVTVLGKDGRPASGLNINDFELLQDGKVQKLVGMTYVEGGGGVSTVTPGSQSSVTVAPTTGSVPLSADFARRFTLSVSVTPTNPER